MGQGVFFGLGGYAMAMHMKLEAAGPGKVPDFMVLYGDATMPSLVGAVPQRAVHAVRHHRPARARVVHPRLRHPEAAGEGRLLRHPHPGHGGRLLDAADRDDQADRRVQRPEHLHHVLRPEPVRPGGQEEPLPDRRRAADRLPGDRLAALPQPLRRAPGRHPRRRGAHPLPRLRPRQHQAGGVRGRRHHGQHRRGAVRPDRRHHLALQRGRDGLDHAARRRRPRRPGLVARPGAGRHRRRLRAVHAVGAVPDPVDLLPGRAVHRGHAVPARRHRLAVAEAEGAGADAVGRRRTRAAAEPEVVA